MKHEEATLFLDEYADGGLDATAHAAVRAHLQECAECRGLLGVIQSLRQAAREHGAALVSDHPAADHLAGYALADGSVTITEAAHIQAHLEVCETCLQEIELVRRANRNQAPINRPRRIWQVAMAAVLLLAIFPIVRGYIGHETLSPLEPAAALTLHLPYPTRTIVTKPPLLRLYRGQQIVPVAVVWDEGPTHSSLDVEVLAEGRSEPLMSFSLDAADAFDPRFNVLGLVLPTALFSTGHYRLVIRDSKDGSVLADREFAVASL